MYPVLGEPFQYDPHGFGSVKLMAELNFHRCARYGSISRRWEQDPTQAISDHYCFGYEIINYGFGSSN